MVVLKRPKQATVTDVNLDLTASVYDHGGKQYVRCALAGFEADPVSFTGLNASTADNSVSKLNTDFAVSVRVGDRVTGAGIPVDTFVSQITPGVLILSEEPDADITDNSLNITVTPEPTDATVFVIELTPFTKGAEFGVRLAYRSLSGNEVAGSVGQSHDGAFFTDGAFPERSTVRDNTMMITNLDTFLLNARSARDS